MGAEYRPGRPIRVLHVVEDLKLGGLERVIETIVTGLPRESFDCRVLCLTRGGVIAESLVARGVSLTVLSLDNYHRPHQIQQLYHWLRREDVQVLHTHGYFAGVFARTIGLSARIPIFIHHVHSTYYNFKPRHLLIEGLLACFTDKIICISKAVQRWASSSFKLSEQKTKVIYNGVTPGHNGLKQRSYIRRESNITEDNVVFIIVASIVKNKGHHILLEALKDVASHCNAVSLVVVGDGPLRSAIERQAARFPKNQVIFTGSQNDVFPYLAMADVLVQPSVEREGLSISILEGMSCYLPVIASNLGGIPEIIDSSTGILVPPGDVHALSRAMIWMINKPGKRREMGIKGHEKWQRYFTAEAMLSEVAHLYNELVQRKIGTQNR